MADLIELKIESRPPARKRRRVVISCFECHRRKQKCDRELPCGNCITRNRESSCAYETAAPTSKGQEKTDPASVTNRRGANGHAAGGGGGADVGAGKGEGRDDDSTLTSMAVALGYSQTSTSTLSLLRTIETADRNDDDDDGDDGGAGGNRPSRYRQGHRDGELEAIRQKYKGLVRQLPAKTFLDSLVDMYFADLYRQYNFIDRDIFFAQLDEWNRLPFQLLASPEKLRPAMRFFPALLFQILATALLLLPPGTPDPVFESLKYAGGMTFEDLATDYSESGAAIVNLFGKSELDEVTVQAQFIRALFQKYTAHVIECWHSIAAAIRDAQELGMHRDSLDPKPADSSVESILENQWRIQRRRKMYMMLVTWDVNMAVFLGRPGSIITAHGLPTLPVDAPPPADFSKTPLEARDEAVDPPTLLTRQLFLSRISSALRYVLDLEPDGAHPRDFSKVDHVHQIMLALEESKPAVFRLENANHRWDAHPQCSKWIHHMRLYAKQLHFFGLMALHRPYIFHRKESRVEALRAAVNMLGIQRQTFDGLPLVQWRGFHLFFGSFDAVVVIASIFILFPHESPELRDSAARRFHWTIAKFEAIREHNSVARAAQGVLKAIQSRFIKAVGKDGAASSSADDVRLQSDSVSPLYAPGSLPSPSEQQQRPQSLNLTPGSGPPTARSSHSGSSATNGGGLSLGISPSDGSMTAAEQWLNNGGGGTNAGMNGWGVPDDCLSSLAPIYATSDLLYNDLVAKYGGDGSAAVTGLEGMPLPQIGGGEEAQQQQDAFGMPFQFDGDFAAENTFWQFLNQFNPEFTG